MTAVKPKSMTLANRACAVLSILILSVAFYCAAGVAVAYADGGDPPANAPAAGTAVAANPLLGSETGSDASGSGTTDARATGANASVGTGLAAAAGPSGYVSDDRSDDVFIGLAPVETDTQATVPCGDMPANAAVPAAVNENPVYVGVTAQVGDAVDLAVAIDYMRVSANEYVEGDTAVLPSTTSGAGASQNADRYALRVNWYYENLARTNGAYRGSPLAQGVYYTDLAEYQRVTGSAPAGSAQLLSVSGVTGADAFTSKEHGISDPYKRFKFDTPYGISSTSSGTSLRVGTTSTVAAYERHLCNYDWQDREIILFFESSGVRAVTAQATLTREIVYGGDTSFIVYASVPVVFYIDVQADVNQGTFIVEGRKPNGDPEDINSLSSNPKFEGSLFKKYKNLDNYAGDSYGEPYDGGENYVMIWEGNRQESCATAGTYKVVAKYSADDTTYKTLIATFTVGNDEFAGGKTVTKYATLQAPGDPDYYWVKFIDEDGKPLGDPQRYEKGASVTPPAPTKDPVGKTEYVLYGWTAVETDQFERELPAVEDNTTYRAYYSAVPQENIKSANGVSASGGLIDQQPDGSSSIASYELSVTPLDLATIPSQKYGVTIIGPNNTALNAYRVHITQHNRDGSTAWITSNVGSVNLTFKVDGVADGTNVRIVQMHEKDAADPNDKDEVLPPYTGTVQNGVMTITLPGKMSTFVVMTEPGAQGDQGGASGDSEGDAPAQGGGTSGGSTTPEQPDDPANAGTPSADATKQEAGAVDAAAGAGSSNGRAPTRAMPSAEPGIGADGSLAGSLGEDALVGPKAAPEASEGGKMPVTGDPLGMHLVPLLASASAIVALYATRRGHRRA